LKNNGNEMEKLQNDLGKLYNEHVSVTEDRDDLVKQLSNTKDLLNEKQKMFENTKNDNEEL